MYIQTHPQILALYSLINTEKVSHIQQTFPPLLTTHTDNANSPLHRLLFPPPLPKYPESRNNSSPWPE